MFLRAAFLLISDIPIYILRRRGWKKENGYTDIYLLGDDRLSPVVYDTVDTI